MKKIIPPFIILLACYISASAQTISLSLEDILDNASQNSADITNAGLDVKAAELQKKEALWEYFPRVSATAIGFYSLNPLLEIGVTDILGKNDMAWEINNQIESLGAMYGVSTKYTALQNGYSTSLMFLQPIFAGGRIINGNRLALVGLKAAEFQRSIKTKQNLLQIENIWWQISSLEDKLQMLAQLKGALDTLTLTLNEAVNAGLASDNERLQLEVKTAELNAGIKKAESGVRLLKMNLLNCAGIEYTLYKGLASDTRPQLDSIILEMNTPIVLEPDHYWRNEEEIISGMNESKLLELQVEAKTLEKKMTIGEALPQIAIGASSGYSDLFHKGRFNTIAFATIQIPISDWGKISQKAQRMQTQIDKAENERLFLTKQLHLRIGQLWLELVSAYDQLQISIKSKETAEKYYNRALSNYNAGLISIKDLLEAQTSVSNAANSHFEAMVNYHNAVIEYNSL